MSTTVTYKGETLTTVSNDTAVLETGGTWLEDDITLTDTTSGGTMQAKTNIDPTTSSQTIEPDEGYDGLSSVQINAMPSGTAGTPTATKGAVSNHSIAVTPSVTNTAGYIEGGTKTGTAVSVSASELDSGAKSITSNGNSQDVVGYATVDVSVPNSYSASDEGKVVSSGALVAQTSDTVTVNDTYDTTTISSLTVNVSGGGGDKAEIDDVTFIDYDGTVLYSYSKSDFLALSAMPANPSHTGLTAQGWNWTLAQAKAYVTNNDYLCIGQTYTTTDGKTHFIVDIDDVAVGIPFRIRYYTTVKGGVTIDWGDGTSEATTANANTAGTAYHTYTTAARYDVTMDATDGKYVLGYSGSNGGIFYGSDTNSRATGRCVKEIHVGKDCKKITRTSVNGAPSVENFTVPNTVETLNDTGAGATGLLQNCQALKSFIIPSGCVMNTYSVAENMVNLRFISWGYGSITSDSQAGRVTSSVPNLEMLTYPEVTELGTGTNSNIAYGSNLLKRFVVPGTYTDIYAQYCREAGGMKKVVIPSTVTSIADYAFSNTVIREWHCKPTSPPTLAHSRALPGFTDGCVIYVPYSADHSILNAYKTATNWTGAAQYMQEEPS